MSGPATPETPEERLTVGQVARRWGVSRTHVQRLCDSGRLPCERNDYRVRFIRVSAADRLRAELTGQVPAEERPPQRPRSPNRVVEHPPALFVVLVEQGRSQRWLARRLGTPPWRVSRYRRGLGQLDANYAAHCAHLLTAAALMGVLPEAVMSARELAFTICVPPVVLVAASDAATAAEDAPAAGAA